MENYPNQNWKQNSVPQFMTSTQQSDIVLGSPQVRNSGHVIEKYPLEHP